jgi:DNA-binding transcriptional LysR family regulator
MSQLPDLEAWAIFAKVAELRSFTATAVELGMSKATVSKAVSRLERAQGVNLLHRTSRSLSLTESGRALMGRAQQLLDLGAGLEDAAREDSEKPRGTIRMAAPMSYGAQHVAPLLAEFLTEYPEIRIDLDLSDERIDIIERGFDLAIRIAALPDSSLRARRLGDVTGWIVVAPSYLERRGMPGHPSELSGHDCISYTNLPNPRLWHFQSIAGEEVSVEVNGPLSGNSGDAMLPSLRAGLGIARLPDFIVDEDLRKGTLVSILSEWSDDNGGIHILTPPGRHRPARVEALVAFLAKRLTA